MEMQVLQAMPWESSFQIDPNWPYIQKMTTTSQFTNISFINFSYWFKFHVNIILGSRVTTIFLSKGLTINLEI